MQPVVEMDGPGPEEFDLWPVAGAEPYSLLPMGGGLSSAEVGTALMRIAAYNDADPEANGLPPRPADPLGGFLHGLIHLDRPLVPGGLRVTDTSTGVTLRPGCCAGLEDWREWNLVLDGGGSVWLGHGPGLAMAEAFGDTVRLTTDADQADGQVIELPGTELRELLGGVERDLAAFLVAAADWTSRYLPGHAAPVTAALARLLDLPVPDLQDEARSASS